MTELTQRKVAVMSEPRLGAAHRAMRAAWSRSR